MGMLPECVSAEENGIFLSNEELQCLSPSKKQNDLIFLLRRDVGFTHLQIINSEGTVVIIWSVFSVSQAKGLLLINFCLDSAIWP